MKGFYSLYFLDSGNTDGKGLGVNLQTETWRDAVEVAARLLRDFEDSLHISFLESPYNDVPFEIFSFRLVKSKTTVKCADPSECGCEKIANKMAQQISDVQKTRLN